MTPESSLSYLYVIQHMDHPWKAEYFEKWSQVKRNFTKHGRLKFQPKAELCLNQPMAWRSSAIIKTFIVAQNCKGLLLSVKTVDLTL